MVLLDHVEKGRLEFKGIDLDGGCIDARLYVCARGDEVSDGSRVVVRHWTSVVRGGGVGLLVGNWLWGTRRSVLSLCALCCNCLRVALR